MGGKGRAIVVFIAVVFLLGMIAFLLFTKQSPQNQKHVMSQTSRTEPVPPEADGFVTYVNAALMEKVFYIPKREGKSHIKHHR